MNTKIRFQKRVKVGKKVTVNLSKSMPSLTVKLIPGLSLNIGTSGVSLNAGLPGTGLSTRTKLIKR